MQQFSSENLARTCVVGIQNFTRPPLVTLPRFLCRLWQTIYRAMKFPRCLCSVRNNEKPRGRHRLLCNAVRMFVSTGYTPLYSLENKFSLRFISPFTRWETNWQSTGDLLAQHLQWLYPHLLTTSITKWVVDVNVQHFVNINLATCWFYWVLPSTVMFSSSRAFDCTSYNWDLNNVLFSWIFLCWTATLMCCNFWYVHFWEFSPK